MPQWESYEQVGTYLLDQFAAEFGLDRVEGKQEVPGQRSGTSWEIDAKGVRQGNDGFMIVEFRRYTTSRQSQEKIGGLAYRIIDTGAKGGIIVSPLGLQEGAGKIAAAEGIVRVILNENCNRYEYMMQFLNQVMIGLHDTVSIKETLDAEIRDKDGNVVRRERIEVAPNHAKKKEEKRWQEPILRNGELVISIPAALLRSGLCPFFHPDRAVAQRLLVLLLNAVGVKVRTGRLRVPGGWAGRRPGRRRVCAVEDAITRVARALAYHSRLPGPRPRTGQA